MSLARKIAGMLGTGGSEIDTTLMATALAAKAPINSPTFTGTVGGITKAHVGLGNVDNTSDANKPVSSAQSTAIAAKANASDVVFTKSYESAQLTPSSAATFTLAHGMGVKPKVIHIFCVCIGANNGYAVGDEVLCSVVGGSTTNDRANSFVSDATNINIRMANIASPFVAGNKNTGELMGLTSTNWRVIIRAYA